MSVFNKDTRSLTLLSSMFNLDFGTPYLLKDMATTFSLPSNHFFYYWQCLSCATARCQDQVKRFQPPLIECIVHKQSFSISDIYKRLNCQFATSFNSSTTVNWGKDFPTYFITDKFLNRYTKILQLIPNESWKETQKKCIHHAFIPFLSDKCNPQSALCPLCSLSGLFLSDRLWSCPLMLPF